MRETIVDRAYAKTLLPPRKEDGHKGDFGKLLVLGGSVSYTGAPYLAASAAVHSGCGLVYLGVPESIWAVEAQKCVSAMPFPLPETDGRLCLAALDKMQDKLKGCDVLALGPGLGRRARDEINVVGVIGNAPQRIVLLAKNKICNHGHCEKNGQGKKGFVRAKRQMPAFVLKGTEFESVENANQTERDYCHTQKNIQKINGLLVQQVFFQQFLYIVNVVKYK